MIFSRFAFTFLLALLPASAELLQARRLSNKEVLAVKADSVSEHLGHYGKPPTGCTDDELVLQIQGMYRWEMALIAMLRVAGRFRIDCSRACSNNVLFDVMQEFRELFARPSVPISCRAPRIFLME
mmetsp:Transcript_5448/g.11152  ORF Transcript_5448/g.11152 Transcript_5448/m.11152 type:complete len:126 (-) Transcript_5448:355-732(-)